MMTPPQAAIMDLLTDFACLRTAHIEKYMMATCGAAAEQVAQMLKQLCVIGRIMLRDGYASLPHRLPRDDVLAAFDVMFGITGNENINVTKGEAPVTLFFTVQSKQNTDIYGIIHLIQGQEQKLLGKVKALHIPGLIAIYIMDSTEQRKHLKNAGQSYFAMKEGDKYKYFKSNK